MATVEQRVRVLVKAGAPEGLLGVSQLVRKLGIMPVSKGEKVVRRWHRQGLGYDKGRPYIFPPFDKVKAWIDSKARCMELIEISGGWARVKPTGWAALVCRACRRSKAFETPNAIRIGPHVMARVEAGVVLVRCWCSAKITRYSKEELPAKDVGLLPELKPKKKKRKA